mmetsp:Transcript_9455/g.20529  ORF Transcript_9455/g.20529 Transcript_9455/m.20529 type:complete len:306 (-) Transcript_9455:591-1508(-)
MLTVSRTIARVSPAFETKTKTVLSGCSWSHAGSAKNWSSSSSSKKGRTKLNWDHVYNLPWPVTLTTRRSDLKLPSTHKQILEKLLEPAPGPVFILGVHLCGVLSIKAIETFNLGPKCVGMALKPCCLPTMEYAKKNVRWCLGNHSFAAGEVCTWGKYNKNQWTGPVKATLGPRFGAWSENLFRGLLADSKYVDRIPLVPGHYQDTYLMASRRYSETPPPIPTEPSTDTLVRSILSSSSSGAPAQEVLGMPEGSSMRGLRRRFYNLTKELGPLIDNSEEAAEAFRRVKVAFDHLLASRPCEATGTT